MAQNRTFKFYGLGYGDTPVTVTASVNSTQIFSGTVPTVDQPIDPWPYPTPEEVGTTVLFTVPDSALFNTDFAGNVPMTVTISTGSGALLGLINSNYYAGNVEIDPGAGTANNFSICYFSQPPNSDGTTDPRSNTAIDGVVQTIPLHPEGCNVWRVLSGSTITYNWNISVGQVGNVLGNSASYTSP
jgi:hypothetical protein